MLLDWTISIWKESGQYLAGMLLLAWYNRGYTGVQGRFFSCVKCLLDRSVCRREGELWNVRPCFFWKKGRKCLDRPLLAKLCLRDSCFLLLLEGRREDSWAALQLSGKEVGRIKQVHEMQWVPVVSLGVPVHQETCSAGINVENSEEV